MLACIEIPDSRTKGRPRVVVEKALVSGLLLLLVRAVGWGGGGGVVMVAGVRDCSRAST